PGQLAQRDQPARHRAVRAVPRVVLEVLELVGDAQLQEEQQRGDEGHGERRQRRRGDLAAHQRREAHRRGTEGGDQRRVGGQGKALALIDDPAIHAVRGDGDVPRASRWWARVKWPAVSAPMIESSPASARPAATSEKARAWPDPARPRISRHARCVGSCVPPPTVPTIRLGSVTAAYSPPSSLASNRVTPTAASATHAASWPHAMKSAARPLAKCPWTPMLPLITPPITDMRA